MVNAGGGGFFGHSTVIASSMASSVLLGVRRGPPSPALPGTASAPRGRRPRLGGVCEQGVTRCADHRSSGVTARSTAAAIALATVGILAALTTPASAAPGDGPEIQEIQAVTSNAAYVQDARGVIARDPYGLCWHTGYWTPADSIPGCDGEIVQ